MLATHELKPGDKVRLLDYGAISLDYRRHLMNMGLRLGVAIEILPKTPVGCPWRVKVQGVFLSLWPKMLETVKWERIVCAS